MLRVQTPICFGNLQRISTWKPDRRVWKTYRIGADLAVFGPTVDIVALRPRNVNHTVHDGVRDMHTLGLVLAGNGLGESSGAGLSGSEAREPGGSFDGSRGTRDDESGRIFGNGYRFLQERQC